MRERQLELEQLRRAVEAERTAVAADRDAFDAQQAAVAADRAELAELCGRLQPAEDTLNLLQKTREAQSFPQLAVVDSASDEPTVSLDWFSGPYMNIHTPPPIPADWANESSVDPADSFTDIGRSDRDVPNISPASRVTAPAAASHRFWEDDTLYDTSIAAHSQHHLPTSFTASSNLMSASAAASPGAMSPETLALGDEGTRLAAEVSDREPLEGSSVAMWTRSLDAVIDSVAPEPETRGSTATATAEDLPSIDQTLAEINQQFGVPMPAQDTSPTATAAALPIWWSASEAPADNLVDDILRSENVPNQTVSGRDDHAGEMEGKLSVLGHDTSAAVPTDSADPLSSLRAQLAQMFDLPATSAAAQDENTETDGAPADDEDSDEDHDSMELTLAPTETNHASELSHEVESGTVPVPHPASPSENETTASHPSAALTRGAIPESTVEAANEDKAEDSIEAYMAQLLSRTRGTEVSTSDVKSYTAPASSTSATSHQTDSTSHASSAGLANFDPADRSHLTAEPKHKQDRQAARDDLQSFRQVAHQSARSALARHTTKNLLSAVIAKTMLLGVSAVATTAFFGAPLVGFSAQIGKGVACSIATLLSAAQVYQSWRQLRRWATTGELTRKNITNPVAAPTPAPESATSDRTADAEPSAAPVK